MQTCGQANDIPSRGDPEKVEENRQGAIWPEERRLSGIINEALQEHIAAQDNARSQVRFKACRGERQIAEAANLDELASMLRKRQTDPRAVRIVSSRPLRNANRTGLPGKRI